MIFLPSLLPSLLRPSKSLSGMGLATDLKRRRSEGEVEVRRPSKFDTYSDVINIGLPRVGRLFSHPSERYHILHTPTPNP